MTTDTAKEQRGFESEVRQLLDLVINSLYSNREIFLRELVSNASDAADKLRFAALSDDALYEGDSELAVDIDFSEELGTITIRDNGIGMSREEAIANLGTIAKSGTREFFSHLSGDAQRDSQLIGQFGVGFYAAFIVADRVTVTTRKAGLDQDQGVRWESEGKGEYTVETVRRKKRGTEIVLELKEDAREYANGWRLREICKRYSDHISIPIRMPGQGESKEREVVNQAQAMWTRPKSELGDDDYKTFYKHVSHDFSDPLTWVHTKVEGKLEYTSLLYIPSQAPFDLWDRDGRHGVKLYVQRVFIMDGAEELMPRYLRFVRGVIDTNDLPLNVSREILQRNKALDSIRGASVKKVIGMIESLAAGDDYATFWRAFGRVMKEGVIEDPGNRERIAKLLRFASTRDVEAGAVVSLDTYVEGMQEGQEAIYYITGDSLQTVRNSPHLEVFRARGIEVLLLDEPVDEWLVTHLTEYAEKPLKSVVDAELEAPAGDDAGDAGARADDGVLERIKNALAERVADVRASRRLTDSPACLVSGGEQMSANLERLLRAAGQEVPESKRILELNLGHPLVRLLEGVADDERFGNWAALLYEQSILAEGGRLDDPAGFVRRMNAMVQELAGQGS